MRVAPVSQPERGLKRVQRIATFGNLVRRSGLTTGARIETLSPGLVRIGLGRRSGLTTGARIETLVHGGFGGVFQGRSGLTTGARIETV